MTQTKMLKFRLLRGNHRVGAQRDENGNVLVPGKNLKPGAIIESSLDLAKRFPTTPPKFERIDQVVEEEESLEETLRQMTKGQLIEKAHSEELDIEGANTKNELIAALLEQLQD